MKFRNGNPPPTVLRIEVTADTVERSVDIPENPEDAVILWPSNPTLVLHPDQTIVGEDMCAPPVAQFPRAKTWKKPECPGKDERKK